MGSRKGIWDPERASFSQKNQGYVEKVTNKDLLKCIPWRRPRGQKTRCLGVKKGRYVEIQKEARKRTHWEKQI